MQNSEGYTADPCNAISLANFEDSFDLQYNIQKRGRELPKKPCTHHAAYELYPNHQCCKLQILDVALYLGMYLGAKSIMIRRKHLH